MGSTKSNLFKDKKFNKSDMIIITRNLNLVNYQCQLGFPRWFPGRILWHPWWFSGIFQRWSPWFPGWVPGWDQGSSQRLNPWFVLAGLDSIWWCPRKTEVPRRLEFLMPVSFWEASAGNFDARELLRSFQCLEFTAAVSPRPIQSDKFF